MSIILNTVFPTVSSVVPTQHLNAAPVAANIVPTFTQNMSIASAAATSVRVWRGQRGYVSNAGGFTGGGSSTFTFNPTTDFFPGETVMTTVSTNATNTIGFGVPLAKPFTWQFRTAVVSGGGISPGTFPQQASGSPYPTGTSSYSVEMGDLDNDGDLDIAVADYNANSVYTLRNTAGVFAAWQTLTAGFHARNIALGDFNNDGRLDIACANIDANSISIYINNGTATPFPVAATQTITTNIGTNPGDIAIGDVNGDGWLDVVTANANNNLAGSLTVCLNNGAGTILNGNPTPFPTGGNGSRYIALGDIDNDGDLDAVTANTNNNTISVMLNNGLGVFTQFGAAFSTGVSVPMDIALVDMNTDGFLDVLAANSGSNSVLQARGNGTGALNFWAAYTVGSTPYGLVVGDFNGTGGPDVVTVNNGDNTITFMPGDGFGGFFANTSWTTPGIGGGWAVAAGDIDGDGDLDIAASNNGVAVLRNMAQMNVQNNVSPFTASVPVVPARNVANAALNTTITIPFSQNLNGASVIAANFRIHGTMGGRRTAAPSFAANTATLAASTPNFLRGEQVWVTVTNAQSAAPDFATTRPFVYGFRAAAGGTGTGNFVDARRYSTGSLPHGTVTGEFDNLPGVDFAVANFGTNTISIYRNDGTGNYPAGNIVTVTLGGASQPQTLAAGDFDNDGDADILVACNGSVWMVRNNGAGSFTPLLINSSASSRLGLAVSDFNADGNLDFAICNNLTPSIQIYSGNGMPSPTFTLLQTINAGAPNHSYTGLQVADVDADGDVDLLSANDAGGGGIYYYL